MLSFVCNVIHALFTFWSTWTVHCELWAFTHRDYDTAQILPHFSNTQLKTAHAIVLCGSLQNPSSAAFTLKSFSAFFSDPWWHEMQFKLNALRHSRSELSWAYPEVLVWEPQNTIKRIYRVNWTSWAQGFREQPNCMLSFTMCRIKFIYSKATHQHIPQQEALIYNWFQWWPLKSLVYSQGNSRSVTTM